jgi:hypothetical protein
MGRVKFLSGWTSALLEHPASWEMQEAVRLTTQGMHWRELRRLSGWSGFSPCAQWPGVRGCPLAQAAAVPATKQPGCWTKPGGGADFGHTRSASSGHAVHVCAAARPRASCLCHWGGRLLRCGAGVRWRWRWAKPDQPCPLGQAPALATPPRSAEWKGPSGRAESVCVSSPVSTRRILPP